jgi:hypothetical protein
MIPEVPKQQAWPIKGQEVYTEEGARAIYVGAIDGRHAIQRILWDGEEECPSSDVIVVDRVFMDEPVACYGSQIQSAQDRLRCLRNQIAEANQQLYEIQKKEQAVRKEADRYPEIATALDFIEGHITHALVEQYGGDAIMPIQDVLKYLDDNKREKGLKLLCLFGNPNKLQWAVNHYSDGSGCWTKIVPFKTAEEAEEGLRRSVEERVEQWRKSPKDHKPAIHNCLTTPYVPQDVRDELEAMRVEARERKISALEAEMNKLIAERNSSSEG